MLRFRFSVLLLRAGLNFDLDTPAPAMITLLVALLCNFLKQSSIKFQINANKFYQEKKRCVAHLSVLTYCARVFSLIAHLNFFCQ